MEAGRKRRKQPASYLLGGASLAGCR